MKVIFITSDFPPGKGGISTLSKNLVNSLQNVVNQLEVHVLFGANKKENIDNAFDVSVYRSGTKSLFGNFLYVLKLCYKNKFSQTIYQTPNLFPLGFFLVVGCLFFGGFALIYSHGTDFLAKGARKITRFLKKFTLKFADRIIFVSESTKLEVLKEVHLKEEKQRVVYCPVFKSNLISNVERKEARAGFNIKENDFIIIRVGNLVYRKGDHLIIKALKELPENIKLFVVGDGKERKNLESLTKRLGLENRVFFFGRVPDTGVYYKASDLFIMASFYDKKEGDIEGLGIVILEAENMGLPVIVARSGGMPEAIDEGKTGLVFAENDTEDLKNKILEIFNNQEMRERFKRNGPNFVSEKFNSEKIANQYLKIYQELLEKNAD